MSKFITARARKKTRTARMLANARKDHSIPLLYVVSNSIKHTILVNAEAVILARGLAHEIHIVEGARHAQRGPVCCFRDGHERSEEET